MLCAHPQDWSTVQWSVDHIVPVKHQGADHWRNYCLMPQRVNSAFGLRSIAKGGVPKQSVVGETAHAAAHAFHRCVCVSVCGGGLRWGSHCLKSNSTLLCLTPANVAAWPLISCLPSARAWVGLMLAPELPAEEVLPLGARWLGSEISGVETAGGMLAEPVRGHFAADPPAGREETAGVSFAAVRGGTPQLSRCQEDPPRDASSPSESQGSLGTGCSSQGEEERVEERLRWSGEAAALDSRCELGDIGDMHLEASAGCAAMEVDEASPAGVEWQPGAVAATVMMSNPFERFRVAQTRPAGS